MFLDLIKLYNKQKDSGRVPLEDFNTECFANILNLYPDIKEDFVTNFFSLPADNYKVITQLNKNLPDTQNCIIDLVFIGKENACLIECKVESSEGWEQLSRYSQVLDTYYHDKTKFLFYLTKYSDVKNLNGEYDEFNYRQFRWYEVAKFLKVFSTTNPLVNDYLKFLKFYNMAQDNTLKSVNLIAMEHLMKTIEISEFHLENSAQNFKNFFGLIRGNSNFSWGQIRGHNRICKHNFGILKSKSGKGSEILYSIQLVKLQLNVHIYVSSDHEQFKSFNDIICDPKVYNHEIFDHGSSINVREDLGMFLNDENADKNINEWFIKSFGLMKNLIVQNPQMDWNI